jgi:hypothetical protein
LKKKKMKVKKKVRVTKAKLQLHRLYAAANKLVRSKVKVKVMTFGDSQLRRYQTAPYAKCFVRRGFKRLPPWKMGSFPRIFLNSAKFEATHVSLSGMGFKRSNHPLVMLKKDLTPFQLQQGIFNQKASPFLSLSLSLSLLTISLSLSLL